MAVCCPKCCCPDRIKMLRVFCVIFGSIGSGIATTCEENSSWTSGGPVYFVCSDPYFQPIIENRGLPCPHIGMEQFYLIFCVTCLLITFILTLLSCCIDFGRAEVIDLGFQIFSSIGYLIAGVVYLVSNEQIYILYKDMFPNYAKEEKIFRIYRIVAGVFAFLASLTYAIATVIIYRKLGKPSKPRDIEKKKCCCFIQLFPKPVEKRESVNNMVYSDDVEVENLELNSDKWFLIKLSKGGVFNPGENVSGQVVLNLKEEQQFKAISISLKGIGYVCWTEINSIASAFREQRKRGGFNHGLDWKRLLKGKCSAEDTTPVKVGDIPMTYTNTEYYISEEKSLLRSANDNLVLLPEGCTALNFTFRLPQNIPSSFKCKKGYVEYSLYGQVSNPGGKTDETFEYPLMVRRELDLNLNSETIYPQTCDQTIGSNFLKRQKGDFKFQARINQSGFIPGQTIEFQVDIRNYSNKTGSVQASLFQIIELIATGRTKVEEVEVATLNSPQVEPDKCEIWSPFDSDQATHEPFFIPDKLHATGLGEDCNVINIKYELRFQSNLPGLWKPKSEKLPILIGTIALNSK